MENGGRSIRKGGEVTRTVSSYMQRGPATHWNYLTLPGHFLKAKCPRDRYDPLQRTFSEDIENLER